MTRKKQILLGLSLALLGLPFLFSAPTQRITFGSCNKHDQPQPLWKPIMVSNPDAFIWLGDVVYADTEDMKVMRSKYEVQLKVPDYVALLKQTKVLGTWDDHDYGVNDGGKFYPKKKESQKEFLDFLQEPKDSPIRNQEGLFRTYTIGSDWQSVTVFVLDTRYHRDNPGPEADILGQHQWEWFTSQIMQTKSQVNIIVSSIQVIPTDHKWEKWANFPKMRKRLLDNLVHSDLPNPIIISGDRHFAEISEYEHPKKKVKIHELTSSGMTHSWPSADKKDKNTHRVAGPFTDLNFGYIEVDWNTKKISLQARDKDNQPQIRVDLDIKL